MSNGTSDANEPKVLKSKNIATFFLAMIALMAIGFGFWAATRGSVNVEGLTPFLAIASTAVGGIAGYTIATFRRLGGVPQVTQARISQVVAKKLDLLPALKELGDPQYVHADDTGFFTGYVLPDGHTQELHFGTDCKFMG